MRRSSLYHFPSGLDGSGQTVALIELGGGYRDGRNVGCLNPQLYREVGPAQILREITEGNNGKSGLAGYSAGSGWNSVAGWGTPDGQKLLDWLRAHPARTPLRNDGYSLLLKGVGCRSC